MGKEEVMRGVAHSCVVWFLYEWGERDEIPLHGERGFDKPWEAE